MSNNENVSASNFAAISLASMWNSRCEATGKETRSPTLLYSNNYQEFDDSKLINGIPAKEWYSMSDYRRTEYMREKRKKEAYKTEMCREFIRHGFCHYGEECRFAHFPEELCVRRIHPKYKTELCRNFTAKGYCVYGSRCQFVHQSLIREVIRPQVKILSENDDNDLNMDIWTPFTSKDSFWTQRTFDINSAFVESSDASKFSHSCLSVFRKKYIPQLHN
ncbi:zinc finger c-x8-C-x5-C-x3-H type (and similar) domain-containing protein [Ditylenchus destructor]|uniref:Zinc finger c-x8-C-x5-C-x3-H type (And similar) domain-containing protein n=1 Tax=Ditylenchus destructor TaxID=166010 RepID=A0AAD4NKV0_9BILA|nr:zinc finger c-x8-C-x5-C-x3-H type (and similar) domain-containing protein [Ditylenchus destructor]